MMARPAHGPEFTKPLTIVGDAGAAIVVSELPQEVALPAWQTLSSVLLWAGQVPALRGDLFELTAMREWEERLLREKWDPELRDPLAVLVGELARLEHGDPQLIAQACMCVTDWAVEHCYWATALGFAEAAGLSWPEQPQFAWAAGRLMRARGLVPEATTWLKRAQRVAVQKRDRDVQALTLSSLGNLYGFVVGDYQKAVKAHEDALRIARRHALQAREGEAMHDLFVAMWHLGRSREAEEYATGAVKVYQTARHPRLPALAHDIANSWSAVGWYGPAFRVIEAAVEDFQEPFERIQVLASLALAAAGCGNAVSFSAAVDEIRGFPAPEVEQSGSALLDVARGAAVLANWALAEQLATEVLESIRPGTGRGLRDIVQDVLDDVANHQMPAAPRNDEGRPRATRLADEILAALHG
jgi:tetratricopeptide (TPR) repeat protein